MSTSSGILLATVDGEPTLNFIVGAADAERSSQHGGGNPPHNDLMDTVGRNELNARLEAIEARMDARVAGMSAKLDTALAEMRADREASSHRFSRMESDLQAVSSGMSALSADVDRKLTAVAAQTADQVKGLKSNIWFGVATTIAAIGATLAIAISSFDSGRETSKSIAEATARMEKLQVQLEAQAKAAAAPPAASLKK